MPQETTVDASTEKPKPIAEIAPTTESTPPKAIRKAPSKTFSIPDRSALRQQINQPKTDEQPVEQKRAESPVNYRDTPFDEADIKAEWEKYIQQQAAAGNHQELTILKEKFEVSGTEIVLSITNAALEGTFEKVKSDLLKHLRNSLQNDAITLRSQVVELDQSKMLYTDQEKFEHLKKKFPALKDLQEKLGLDPEF